MTDLPMIDMCPAWMASLYSCRLNEFTYRQPFKCVIEPEPIAGYSLYDTCSSSNGSSTSFSPWSFRRVNVQMVSRSKNG